MTKDYYIDSNLFLPILEHQRNEFFHSLNALLIDGRYKLAEFEDKNYNCMSYIESALEYLMKIASVFDVDLNELERR